MAKKANLVDSGMAMDMTIRRSEKRTIATKSPKKECQDCELICIIINETTNIKSKREGLTFTILHFYVNLFTIMAIKSSSAMAGVCVFIF